MVNAVYKQCSSDRDGGGKGKRASLGAGNGLWSAVGVVVNTEEKEGERKPDPRWWCGTLLPDLQVIHKHRPRARCRDER